MVKGTMTFYAFLMTLRNPDENTEMATFANADFMIRLSRSNPSTMMKSLTTWNLKQATCLQ